MNLTGLHRLADHPWLLLLGLGGLLSIFMLGGHSFWDIDEPINAQCAKEMLSAGNWLVPTFNDSLRTGKPILTYWCMLASYSLFGVSEFSARLPSALSIILLAIILSHVASRLTDRRTGLLAGLLFATSIHVIVISRAATPDGVFLLTLCSGLLAGMTYILEGMRSRSLLWTAYICFGLATLAKGPVAIVLPGLILLAYLALMGQLANLRLFHPFIGLGLILAVALPWYVAVTILTDGEWLRRFLFVDNLHRFVAPMEGHRGFPGFYLITLMLGVFPWTGALIGAVIQGPWRLRALRQDPLRMFLLVWIAVFFLFFSLARTRLPHYLLPAFPAISLWMALWIRDQGSDRAGRFLLWAACILALTLMIGGGIALEWQWPGEGMLALSFAPIVMAVAVAWMLRRHLVAIFACGMIAMTLLLAGWALPTFDKHKISKSLAQTAIAAGFGCGKLSTYRYFQPSIVFYHCAPIKPRSDIEQAVSWLRQGKALVMPSTAMGEFPPSLQQRLVIHGRGYDLYARGELVLVSLNMR